MQINKYLRIFKTPLDAEYKNVYDDYNMIEDYIDFLTANFENISIPYETYTLSSKSRKDENGSFNIVINGYTSMDLHDYNYIVFGNGHGEEEWFKEYKFAFITSVISENDSKENPSCRLICKLDVWSNNYLNIKENNTFTSIITTRATYDTNKLKFYPSKIKLGQYETEYDSRNNGYFVQSGSKQAVLWQRIVLSDAPTITGGVGTYSGYTKSFIKTGGSFVIYKPVEIMRISSVSNAVVFSRGNNTDYNIVVYGKDSPTGIEMQLFSFNKLIDIADCKSSFVISNQLCYSVPFDYYLEFDTSGEIYKYNLYLGKLDRFGNISYDTDFASGNHVSCGTTEIINGSFVIMPLSKFTAFYDIAKEYSIYSSREISGIDRYSLSFFDAIIKESVYNEYPSFYSSIIIGNDEIPLLPISGTNGIYTLKYDCSYKINPSIRIFSDTKQPLYRTVMTDGYLDVRNLAYDEYMARNSNVINNEKDKTYFHLFRNLGSAIFNPSGLLNTIDTVFDLENIESRMKDLKNTPTTILNKTAYSIDNPFALDSIIVCEHTNDLWQEYTINSVLTNPLNQIIYDYHLNGYEVNMIKSLIDIDKDFFDILKGDLTISSKMNNTDKEELISACKRGFTRWHIRNANPLSQRANILTSMNRNVVNINISEI